MLVLGDDERGAAQVGVVMTDTVDDDALRALRALRCSGVPRLVVVAGRIDDADLATVTEVGVAGVVRHADATADRLVSVVTAAAAGEGHVPPDLLGRLLAQVGELRRHVLGPRGLTFSGLTEREIEVLKSGRGWAGHRRNREQWWSSRTRGGRRQEPPGVRP